MDWKAAPTNVATILLAELEKAGHDGTRFMIPGHENDFAIFVRL
jgi:hypothetical protein